MKGRWSLLFVFSVMLVLSAALPGGEPFVRGNANDDDRVDIADVVFTLSFLFRSGPSPACEDAADANDDGLIDLGDPLYTAGYLFFNGSPPPRPGPCTAGFDATPSDPFACGDSPIVRVPADASTIQEAVNALAGGGTVVLAANVIENVVIDTDKIVRIEGAGDEPAAVKAGNEVEAVIHVKGAQGVELFNLAIAGGSVGVRVSGTVPILLERTVLRENIIGVRVDHGSEWVPEAATRIQACDLWNNTDYGLLTVSAPLALEGTRFSGNGCAVRVEGAHYFAMHDSIVAQSTGSAGAYFLSSDHVTLDTTLFWENNGLGAAIFWNTMESSIRNCVVNANGTVGILLLDSASIEIEEVVVRNQSNPLTTTLEFHAPSTRVYIGDLDSDFFLGLAPPAFPPRDLDVDFGDDTWQGNGVEINGSSRVVIASALLGWNEGSGILVRDSETITVLQGDIFLNAMSGITTLDSNGVWIHGAAIYNNFRTAVQLVGGSSLVDYSNLSGTFADTEGAYGYGVSCEGGTHYVEFNDILDNALSGMLISGDVEGQILSNQIHGAPYGIALTVGVIPDLVNNEVTCTLPGECVVWTTMDPSPAPAPDLPPEIED